MYLEIIFILTEYFFQTITGLMGFSGDSLVKNPPVNAGDTEDTSLIPGSGRSPGGGIETRFSFLA